MTKSMRLALLWTLVPAVSFAGNEAGGSWVVNRFKARAYEALAEICRQPKEKSLLDAEEIRRFEKALEETSVLPMRGDDPDLIEMEGNAGVTKDKTLPGLLIKLHAERWGRFFDRGMDVFPEVLSLYLSTFLGHRSAAELAVKFDSSTLAGQSAEQPGLTVGKNKFRVLPGLYLASDADRSCGEEWRTANDAELKSAASELVRHLDSLRYKTPRMYQAWAQSSPEVAEIHRFVDLESGALKRAEDMRSGPFFFRRGVVCVSPL